jgi:hypothetical protein
LIKLYYAKVHKQRIVRLVLREIVADVEPASQEVTLLVERVAGTPFARMHGMIRAG